jgi:hypothetical protein
VATGKFALTKPVRLRAEAAAAGLLKHRGEVWGLRGGGLRKVLADQVYDLVDVRSPIRPVATMVSDSRAD